MTCSMLAGQISWQARQVVQAQRTSLVTVSTRFASGLAKATSPICLHHLHRGERLVGGPGRAAVLAALAGGAGVGVEDVLPGEIGDLRRPVTLDALVLQVDGLQRPLGPQIGEEVVDRGGEDVAQLGERDGGDEADGQEEVEPPEPLVQRRSSAAAMPAKTGHQEPDRGRRRASSGLTGSSVTAMRAPSMRKPVMRMAKSRRDEVIVPAGLQPLRLHEKAAHQKPGQHGDGDQAGHVEHQLEDL